MGTTTKLAKTGYHRTDLPVRINWCSLLCVLVIDNNKQLTIILFYIFTINFLGGEALYQSAEFSLYVRNMSQKPVPAEFFFQSDFLMDYDPSHCGRCQATDSSITEDVSVIN